MQPSTVVPVQLFNMCVFFIFFATLVFMLHIANFKLLLMQYLYLTSCITLSDSYSLYRNSGVARYNF